jgi:glycosyltransferase involved in cell wall biosynthesis/8-oxo-dGTP pyrophosphatase MutT (NUDIX family)
MKALFVATEYPPIPGGGATFSATLVEALKLTGGEVVVLTSGETDEEIVDGNLKVIRKMEMKKIYEGEGGIILGVNVLLEVMRAEVPDVLHTHHSVETLMGIIANQYYGLPHYATLTKTPEFKDQLTKKNGKWGVFDYTATSKGVKHITLSQAYIKNLQQLGVRSENMTVVYPGVDEKRFRRAGDDEIRTFREKLGVKEDDFLLVVPCVARKRKGLEFLARSIEKCIETRKQIKVIVTGVPDPTHEDHSYFRKIAETGTLLAHWRFEDEEMPLVYSSADAAALVSEAEGLGLSLLEAMACNTPVIGTNVIGINEVISDGVNGILIEHGDVEGFERAFFSLMDDREFRSNLIEGGKRALSEKFSLQVQGKRHWEIYEAGKTGVVQSSGGVVFRENEGKLEVFMIKHAEYGYVLPKGRKNKGETWLEAAAREVREETGYEVFTPTFFLDELGYSFEKEGRKVDKVVRFYAFKVEVDAVNLGLKLDEGEKVLEGTWLAIDEAVKSCAHQTEGETINKLIDLYNDR